jgi:predicted ferric reductase
MELATLLFRIGNWMGIIGLCTLGLLIVSGDIARYVDRYVGLDRIIPFQRYASYVVSVFLLAHPILFAIADREIAYYVVPSVHLPELAAGIVSLYLFLLVMIASALYKRISYKIWQYIHIGTYVLFFLGVYHAITWGSDEAFIPLYLGISLLVILGMIYRTFYKLRTRTTRTWTIHAITQETHDTFSILFKKPKGFEFNAGQFCFLRIEGKGLHARHPFTISSAPHEDLVRFTIKDSGRFTKYLWTCDVGDELIVEGPFGVFTPSDDEPLVCIAGGVGITPFMSIVKQRAQQKSTQPVHLIYASKTVQDMIFFNELEQLTQHMPLKITYILSEETTVPSPYRSGRIDTRLLNEHLNPDAAYYICGPQSLRTSVMTALKKLGIPHRAMHYENFFW